MRNSFDIVILPDGRIKVTNEGGFAPDIHTDADNLLELLKDLAGGECKVTKHAKTLGNPQTQTQQQNLKH